MPRRPKTEPLPNALPRPIAMPEWAKPVESKHAGFEELLACALVEWHLVFQGAEVAVFRELARAARREWARRGKTSDEALQVAYELLRLAPGISECVDRPEYAWLRTPKAAIEECRGTDDWYRVVACRFERRAQKKAGAPSRNEPLRATFEILRSKGVRYGEAIRQIAAVLRWRADGGAGATNASAAARTFRGHLDAVTDEEVDRVKKAVRPPRSGRRVSREVP